MRNLEDIFRRMNDARDEQRKHYLACFVAWKKFQDEWNDTNLDAYVSVRDLWIKAKDQSEELRKELANA